MQPINVAQHYVDATNKTTPERDILAPVFVISSFYRGQEGARPLPDDYAI
jgi:hypothetical protein